jgi:inhibitor of KinA
MADVVRNADGFSAGKCRLGNVAAVARLRGHPGGAQALVRLATESPSGVAMSSQDRDVDLEPNDTARTSHASLPALQFEPMGDSGLVVRFGDRIDLQVHHRVRALSDYLLAHTMEGVLEFTPAFTTICLFYDPGRWALADLCAEVQRIIERLSAARHPKPRIVEIPVCYGGLFGPDLRFVAQHNHLSEDEVVQLHVSGEYLTYMIGFAPGFPYLGGMSDRIGAPRRMSPRQRVPAGSVGIAGNQTGIYPLETPGGWQLIGRTPVTLFRPLENPPSVLQVGDAVRFRTMSPLEFQTWRETHP